MKRNDTMITMLDNLDKTGSQYTAAAGFDMVIDNVVRMIRQKDADGKNIYFNTIEEFGKYLLSKKNMSCSIEMETQEEKIGGNMAIFSNALGTLGVQVDCIGSMGYPEIHPLFLKMNKNCRLYNICKTANCSALEFNDGKVMLSSMDVLNELNWELLLDRIDQNQLISIFQNSQLIALLNWSELMGATRLFTAVYENTIEDTYPQKEKFVLIDLSDASRKPEEEILKILKLGEQFTPYRTTIFSMNENECRLVYHALFQSEANDIEEMGKKISETLKIDNLIVHLLDRSYGYRNGNMFLKQGYYTEKPRISTGGGDNFNAGVCLGFLHHLEIEECLQLGNAASGYYVRTAKSPTAKQLHRFITTERISDNSGR